MAVAFRTQATGYGASGVPSLTIPGSVQVGDLLLITWHTALALQLNLTALTADGWALVDSQHALTSSEATALFKIAVSGDIGKTISLPNTDGANGKTTAVLTAWSGVHQTTPIHKVAFTGTNASTAVTHATPTVTTTVPDCMIVSAFMDKDSTETTFNPPASPYTERARRLSGGGGASNNIQASKLITTAGVYGGETWGTPTAAINKQTAVYTFALQPALPPTGPPVGPIANFKIFRGGVLTSLTAKVYRNAPM